MKPYYVDDTVTLYHGDCREVLSSLALVADACVADPPYGETTADWDRWPDGWVKAVGDALPASASLWCFGTARMFLDHANEFAGWKFGQEALWLKRNGSGPGSRDRLLKVHEWAYHWYRGRWTDLHHEWERERVHSGDKSTRNRASHAAVQRRPNRHTAYEDDGYRQPRSVRVIESPTVRYQKRHQDEKPVKVVAELVRACTPPGGVVLDPMAGVGTTGVAAAMTGRRAVLIEADERYCEAIANRLQQDVLAVDVPEPPQIIRRPIVAHLPECEACECGANGPHGLTDHCRVDLECVPGCPVAATRLQQDVLPLAGEVR